MTESQILDLLKQHGGSPMQVRKQPSTNILRVRPRELDFVDVLLQGGAAVAVQRGNYIAFTAGMEFGQIRMLCGAAPMPADRTLSEYDRRTSGAEAK